MLRTILRILRALSSSTPMLVSGGMYSRTQLDQTFGENDRRFKTWREAGLRPLGTGTREEYFLADELFEVWKRMRDQQEVEK